MQDIDFSQIGNGATGDPKQTPKPPKPAIPGAIISLKFETAKRDLIGPYLAKGILIKAEALKIQVNNDASKIEATDLGSRIHKLIKQIDEKADGIIKDPKQYVSEVNNIRKQVKKALEEAKEYLREELKQHKAREDLANRKQEELIRKKNEELQKELDEEAKKSGIEAPKVGPVRLPGKDNITRTESGSSHGRGQWKYEVLDITQVPRNYLKQEVDPRYINIEIKHGLRDEVDKDGNLIKLAIPGIRIFWDETIAFR